VQDDIVPFTPTATDNCNSVVAVTLEGSITTAGTCTDNFTRTETYLATDSCGNQSDPFVYTIIVNDTIAPTADTLPNLVYACVADIPDATTTVVTNASDNCTGMVTISIVGTEIPTTCSDIITRTYRLTDRCGNSSDLLQRIMINDDTPPTADPLPDLTFSCAENITPHNTNDVTGMSDNCGGIVMVAFFNQTTGDNCNNTLIRPQISIKIFY